MGRVALIVFLLLATYLIFRTAFKAWKRVSVKAKVEQAKEIEGEFETVTDYEARYQDIVAKRDKVSNFKKEKL